VTFRAPTLFSLVLDRHSRTCIDVKGRPRLRPQLRHMCVDLAGREASPDRASVDTLGAVFDIDGYEPDWRSGASTLLLAHGPQLAELAGRSLTSCWVVWDASDDSWFADAPVVLDFEGRHLEICHNKFDELDIGWGRIDLDRQIRWQYEEDGPMPLSWREDRMPALDRFRGQVLRECSLQEWIGDDLANGMVAVGLTFGEGGFVVSNGLDENQIDVGPMDPRFRKVR